MGTARSPSRDSTTQFDNKDLEGVKLVAMDMWEPYIQVTKQYVPHAEQRIAFDRFHVAEHLGDAVDKVRREEHRAFLHAGDDRLGDPYYGRL